MTEPSGTEAPTSEPDDAPQESSPFQDEGLTAAEREYQAALHAAESIGLDTTPAPAADEDVDTEAGELAARLGFDQPLEVKEEAPVASIFDEPEEPPEPEEDELDPAAADLLQDPGDGRSWYVLNTYSGHESRVEKNLDMRIKSMDVSHKIFRIIVPTEEELEIRGGQRRHVQRKLLPGYVLVEMILDDDTWYVVRNTPGVTGFVGTEHPVPLPQHEVLTILKQMQTGGAEPRIRVGFEIGDSIRVMEGPFNEFIGEVDEINLDKGKVRVLISMFGRDTPVELDFIQVAKV
ncbi:MAG TPA: transcription termination/antitermination protein NusG [Dehalococcoidia bacterium]|nr:transcription termination/antitermination protein NusG [Dehalococcoidia bacterium]